MAVKPHGWHKTALALATASLLGLGSTQAWALALGRIDVLSALEEPLQAEVDLPGITDEEAATLKANLAAPDTFRAAGLVYLPGLNNLQITLQKRDGRSVLVLRGDTPIGSPYVDLIVEASWSAGRSVRGYTVLLPPPRQLKPEPQPAPSPTPQVTPAAPPPPPAVVVAPTPPSAPAPAAPAAAVAPGPGQAATGAVAGDKPASTRVQVKYGDTAGRIALANLPATISLEQMLIALLETNPEAFVNGNVNRLKAGAVLDIPSAEQALAIDAQQARRMVRAQSRDFNEYRRKLAGMAPQAPAQAATRKAGGAIEAQVEDKKPSAEAADKLTLSKGKVQGKSDEDELSRQGNQKEAERQADELAKNIAELKKLSAEIAQTAATPEASAPASEAASAPTMAPTVVGAPLPASEPASAPASAASAPASAASAPASAAMPAKASMLDTLIANPLLVAGAGAVLALLAALGLIWARRRGKSEGPSFQETLSESIAAQPAPALATAGETVVEEEQAPSDPVEEAEAFLAYGREQQAEDILRAGLLIEPQRLAIHEKLLEIYAKRMDSAKFEEIARRVHQMTGGAGDQWNQTCSLGISIDPDNPLYHRAQAGGAAETAMFPTEEPPPTFEETSPVEPAFEPQPELPLPSDLDLSLDKPVAQTVEVEVPGEQAAPAPQASEPDLSEADLDLDLEALQQDRAPTPAPAAGLPPADFDLNSINLDLGTPSEPEPAPDNPLSIKMALAEEFSAIGDTDGARSLLEEVIAEAEGELRAKAEEALQKLG